MTKSWRIPQDFRIADTLDNESVLHLVDCRMLSSFYRREDPPNELTVLKHFLDSLPCCSRCKPERIKQTPELTHALARLGLTKEN